MATCEFNLYLLINLESSFLKSREISPIILRNMLSSLTLDLITINTDELSYENKLNIAKSQR